MDRIQTGCKVLDSLTDGGLPTGTITQIFGEKALGKSILSLQAGFATVAGGNSAIILDTEQSYASYLLPYRKAGLEKRYGTGAGERAQAGKSHEEAGQEKQATGLEERAGHEPG